MAASASKKCGGHASSSSFVLAELAPYAADVSAALTSAAVRFRLVLALVAVSGDAARPLRFRPLDEDSAPVCDESWGGYDWARS